MEIVRMKKWQTVLKRERNALKKKLDKLEKDCKYPSKGIGVIDLQLLKKQLVHMQGYYAILEKRCARYKL